MKNKKKISDVPYYRGKTNFHFFEIDSPQAVNFGIERLKEKVPIWKKEKYEEGGEAWKVSRPRTKRA